MATNVERTTALLTDYFAYSYLPQLVFQAFENNRARADLKKAIAGKCGAAGAMNTSALEKDLLSTNPLRPFRWWNRIPVSNHQTLRLPIPFTGWRMPIFPGINNPFLLAYGGVQTTLNDHPGWGSTMIGASFLLADANRGFGLISRVPGLNAWGRLGANSPYQVQLRTVTEKIQCNGPSGGEPEAVAEEKPAPAAEPAAAAPAPTAFVATRNTLAAASLAYYQKRGPLRTNASTPAHSPMVSGLANTLGLHSIPLASAPITLPASLPLPKFNFLKITIVEPLPMLAP